MALTRPTRRQTVWIAVAAVVILVALVWHFRWGLGGRVVRIADPVVRRWAAAEMARLSDGAYELTATPIRVDTERRRVSIDTIVIVTNSTRNAARPTPLPAMTLHFNNCALDGIDLERLATRGGLSASRAGCDMVMVSAEVPAPTRPRSATADAEGAFLALRRNLDLGRDVPFIRVDSVAFPNVTVAIGIAGRGGRRTFIAFERLAVRLDSLHYDPNQPVAERRTLLSRNATVTLDGFQGSQEAANRLLLDRFRADLASGTLELDGFDWEPIPGPFADSLGLAALAVDTLRVAGIDWGAFLTAGDIRVHSLWLAGGRMRLPPPRDGSDPQALDDAAARPTGRRTAESMLRAVGREMVLDTLRVRDLTLVEAGAGDSVLTSLGSLTLAGVSVGLGDSAWSGPFPMGRVRIIATDVLRDGRDGRFALGRLVLDLASGTSRLDSLRTGATGSDAGWVRGRRWRADRTALAVDSIITLGLDAQAWARTGAYRGRRVEVHGVDLDISTDKRLPARSVRATRRHPQAWIRAVPPPLHIDTIRVTGRLQYRERSPDAAQMGTVRFERLVATITNVSTDPRRMSDRTPMVFRADARLMGVGPFRLEASIPLLAPDFRMRYEGSLGQMQATALNPFIVGLTPVEFKEGRILGIAFQATVSNGRATGTLRPRWDSLFVNVTEGGGGGGGILGGIKRAVTKFAANEFMLRSENSDAGDDPPLDAPISHRWVPQETLLQFMWAGIRNALLPLVKR